MRLFHQALTGFQQKLNVIDAANVSRPMERRSALGVESVEIRAATQQQAKRIHLVVAATTPQRRTAAFLVNGVDVEVVTWISGKGAIRCIIMTVIWLTGSAHSTANHQRLNKR